MGKVDVSCVEGCACDAATLDAHFPARRTSEHVWHTIWLVPASAPAAPLPASLAGNATARRHRNRRRCSIRVRVRHDTGSGGHAFKLVGLVQGEERLTEREHRPVGSPTPVGAGKAVPCPPRASRLGRSPASSPCSEW